MSNDLVQIKHQLLEEDRIPELLEKANCEHIRLRNNRYEAALPDKFGSDNLRSLQVYLNEGLTCKVRTRTFQGQDIYDLISFIVFDCEDEESIKKCLPKSKRWICEQLGYQQYISGFLSEQPKEDPLKWLRDLKKKRNKKKIIVEENEIYDESILNQYVMYPYKEFVDKGIDYRILQEFGIGFDVKSERVIFPIRNRYGEIVSIKGRTIDPFWMKKGIPKFLYLYNFNMMTELYNLDKAMYYILENKEIIIYEGEKTCWLSSQWGFRNCVALGGSEITTFQADMIKELSLDTNIVLGFDKDKPADEIKKQAKKFGLARNVYVMWDGRDVFSAEEKHSPTDLGEEAFRQLYEDRVKYKIM